MTNETVSKPLTDYFSLKDTVTVDPLKAAGWSLREIPTTFEEAWGGHFERAVQHADALSTKKQAEKLVLVDNPQLRQIDGGAQTAAKVTKVPDALKSFLGVEEAPAYWMGAYQMDKDREVHSTFQPNQLVFELERHSDNGQNRVQRHAVVKYNDDGTIEAITFSETDFALGDTATRTCDLNFNINWGYVTERKRVDRLTSDVYQVHDGSLKLPVREETIVEISYLFNETVGVPYAHNNYLSERRYTKPAQGSPETTLSRTSAGEPNTRQYSRVQRDGGSQPPATEAKTLPYLLKALPPDESILSSMHTVDTLARTTILARALESYPTGDDRGLLASIGIAPVEVLAKIGAAYLPREMDPEALAQLHKAISRTIMHKINFRDIVISQLPDTPSGFTEAEKTELTSLFAAIPDVFRRLPAHYIGDAFDTYHKLLRDNAQIRILAVPMMDQLLTTADREAVLGNAIILTDLFYEPIETAKHLRRMLETNHSDAAVNANLDTLTTSLIEAGTSARERRRNSGSPLPVAGEFDEATIAAYVDVLRLLEPRIKSVSDRLSEYTRNQIIRDMKYLPYLVNDGADSPVKQIADGIVNFLEPPPSAPSE